MRFDEPSERSDRGLTQAQAAELLERYGPNAIPLVKPHALWEIAKRFWGPIPWVLEGTLVLTIATRRYGDGVAIAFLLVFNAVVASIQEGRARDALDLLRAKVVVQSRVKRNQSWSVIPADQLVPGDLVHVGVGDVVPADIRLTGGSIEVDQSVLTGESVPRSAAAGEIAYAGTTVTRGDSTAIVIATGRSTEFGKTAELVRIAKTPGQLEGVVLRIVTVLSGISLVVIGIVAAFAARGGFGVVDIVVFTIMILLAAVPIALPAAFTLATTLGSLELAKRGALITRLSALEDAASMDVLCTDKTGTITQNRIVVEEILAFPPFSAGDVAALAVAASDDASQDPVDLAVLRYHSPKGGASIVRESFVPFDPARKLSSAAIFWHGTRTTVSKGAPAVLRSQAQQVPARFDAELERLAGSGARVIAVGVVQADVMEIAGVIALADPPREDAAALIRRLHDLGITVRLLTGDSQPTALHVAHEVGIQQDDVYASIYPQDKLAIVKRLQEAHHVVGMTGDGVNDAPALRQANMGIAVSTATDVAKAAAGIVLTAPGLANIVSAIGSSRAVFERMVTYTMMKFVKYFEIVGVLTAGFFVLRQFLLRPELMVALLIFNDLVTLSISTDNVSSAQTLDTWRVGRLLASSLAIAVLTALTVAGVTVFAQLTSHLRVDALRGVVFLAMVVMGQLAVFVVRDRRSFFGPRPSRWLLASSLFAVAAATSIVGFGVLTPALPATLIAKILGLLLAGGFILMIAKMQILGVLHAFTPRRCLHTVDVS
ncbi:MAG TPA: HAD-IC family P-type ATPase [Candidatus Rubrimentiphilum sp.]|nr:HAD-IC family P-type ATPase [Candidatus Rubrimentiphilum sp.]